MKLIRMFILFVIGMMTFTGTANTTANLGQKQKVELVKDCTFTVSEQKFVDVFQSITLSQTVVAIISETVNSNFIRKSSTFYVSRTEVGWRRLKNNTTNKLYIQKFLQNHVAANQDLIKVFLIQKCS